MLWAITKDKSWQVPALNSYWPLLTRAFRAKAQNQGDASHIFIDSSCFLYWVAVLSVKVFWLPAQKKSKWTPRNSALVCTAEHMNRTRISSFSKNSFRILDAVQLVYQLVSYLVPLKMVVWKVFTAKRCEEYQIFLPNAWLVSMSMSMCVCECQVHGRNKESLTVIPCIALVGFSLARQSWMAQHTCNAL